MAKVSVLILAKNEEKFIGACIKSVLDFAGEVAVIDDGSISRQPCACALIDGTIKFWRT